MPYKSDQQRKFFHSAGAKKAGISKSTVAEFDSASKGLKLPKRKTRAAKQVMQAVSKRVSK